MDVISHILLIIENPLAEKAYKDLKKYYESIGMLDEAAAFGDLIAKRFNENNNPSSNQQ